MKISFTGLVVRDQYHFNNQSVGYGRVAYQFYHALKRAGANVVINDATADINFCCDDPGLIQYVPGQYNIAFSTHESTEIVEHWKNNLQEMEEVWTMSEWICECFSKYVSGPITVIPTCISDIFTPTKRKKMGPFYFLHTGEPTARKNGQMVFDAFDEEFKHDDDVFMVFKSYGGHTIRNYQNNDNVIFINQELSNSSYKNLLYKMHCLVYPSSGCGGGMMPQEAMATGMPVIAVSEWMDYKNYIHLPVKASLGPVPDYISNNTMLKGNVYIPDFDSLKQQMRNVYINYNKYENIYYDQASQIIDEYNWDRVVKEIAIPRLQTLSETL